MYTFLIRRISDPQLPRLVKHVRARSAMVSAPPGTVRVFLLAGLSVERLRLAEASYRRGIGVVLAAVNRDGFQRLPTSCGPS